MKHTDTRINRTSSIAHSAAGRHLSIIAFDLTDTVGERRRAAQQERELIEASKTTDAERESAQYLVNLNFMDSAARCPRDLSHPASWVVEVLGPGPAPRTLLCRSLSLRAGTEFSVPYERLVTLTDRSVLNAEQIAAISSRFA